MALNSVTVTIEFWASFKGWESQILETGFLAAFLCPLLTVRSVPKKTPTSFIAILGFRWLIFRIMIGAVSICERLFGIKFWVYFDFLEQKLCFHVKVKSHLFQGLIKIRGDQCWRDLTCMNYHYEVHSHKRFSVKPSL